MYGDKLSIQMQHQAIYGRWVKVLKDSDISLGNDTIYKITHQAYGTTPPPAQAGKTIICLFTE